MNFQLAKVIGHRGACGHAPENTLISLSKASELGATWVEFDVMLTRCGEAIVIHDFSLCRTTDGQGEVAETNFEAIARLDCGSWFAEEFKGQRVPRLKDILIHSAQLNLAINVEIKPYPGMEIATAKTTLEVLNSNWPNHLSPPLISSFSETVLKTIDASGEDYNLGYIIDSWESGWEQVVKKYGCISLHVDHELLTHDIVKKIKDKGLLVLAYTVNDAARAKELFEWGVDSVFTDFPDRILHSLPPLPPFVGGEGAG